MTLPKSVVEQDHRLEGVIDRSSLELAELRWHWTLDESNPDRVSQSEYGRAIGRKPGVIGHYARGWALYRERLAASPASSGGFTIQDAIRLAELKAEDQQFAEIIAEEEGRPIAQVSRGDNRHRMRETVARAKDRAERRGTEVADEVRQIARGQRLSKQGDQRRKEDRAQRRGFRLLGVETNLSAAKDKLRAALKEAELVEFSDEELELLRVALDKVQQILQLLDLRLGGASGIDWEAELAKLGDQ